MSEPRWTLLAEYGFDVPCNWLVDGPLPYDGHTGGRVEVMPVAEHEAERARLEAENARLREAAQAVLAPFNGWQFTHSHPIVALRAALAPAADEGEG